MGRGSGGSIARLMKAYRDQCPEVITRRHTEAAVIPTHRSSPLAQEAGMAGLRGGFWC
jgi:hypothetical protein